MKFEKMPLSSVSKPHWGAYPPPSFLFKTDYIYICLSILWRFTFMQSKPKNRLKTAKNNSNKCFFELFYIDNQSFRMTKTLFYTLKRCNYLRKE